MRIKGKTGTRPTAALAFGCILAVVVAGGGCDQAATDSEAESGQVAAPATNSPSEELDGSVVGTITLRPSLRQASFGDLCVASDQKYSIDDDELLTKTTAFAVLTGDDGSVRRVPFLASQLIGGSMEFGPVRGFFDEPAPPGSRDAITLPYQLGALTIEIEGITVTEQPTRIDATDMAECGGTSPS